MAVCGIANGTVFLSDVWLACVEVGLDVPVTLPIWTHRVVDEMPVIGPNLIRHNEENVG